MFIRRNLKLILIALTTVLVTLSLWVNSSKVNDLVSSIPFVNDSSSSVTKYVALESTDQDNMDSTVQDISLEESNKTIKYGSKKGKEVGNNPSINQTLNFTTNPKNNIPSGTRQVRILTLKQFPDYSKQNVRGKLILLFNTFEEGDFITGAEFAKVFKKNTHISSLLKGTVASYIEAHIAKITRVNNALVINTREVNGIHSNIKIPLVDDIQVDISNGARIVFGKSFQSDKKLFKNIYLLPLELQNISFTNNNQTFPSKGYVSGNLFYYQYFNTRMAYPFSKK